MLKILKNNLRKSWWAIIIIFALLCAQAMADLNLPDFTSKIVNVGIQQKGIENSSPDAITKATMDKVLLVTEEDEFLLENYQVFSKDNFSDKEYNQYLKKYPNIDKQETYVIKKMDSEKRDKLNLEMGKALMFTEIFENKEYASKMGGQQTGLKYSEIPDSIIKQAAIASVQKEYQTLGVNLDDMQNKYIFMAGLRMLGVAALSMIAAILITLLSAKVAAELGKNVREKVYKKVLSFSSSEYRKFGSSSLITRNTNDVQQIQNMVPMLFRTVIYAPIVGIGAFLKVLNQSENSMSWIIGTAIAVIIVVIGGLFGLAMPKFKKLQDLIDKLNMVSREILTGIPVIRAFNKEKYEENKFDVANTDLTKTNIFINRTMSFMMPTLMFIMNGMSLLIIWNGAQNVDKGVMQVGTVMTFMQYSMQVVISFLFISILSIILPRASVSAKRINEVLETENLVKDAKNLKTLDKSKKGLVEFRKVSFRYPDADSEVLSDIDFVAKPGEVTAIIGSTGSGKSTVVNLLPRFYDVTEGEILVDGVNIKDVSQKDLRDVIGFVPQKGVLFSGTIESNIKYSDENMSDENMIKAAQIAQAEEFISAKSDTYNSEISQGGNNVSGGQKQRLSIARAIAKNPEIFVFDDSFSALDFKTDLKLRTALEEVTQDKTVIIVAQRISTIMDANQIIVLDEGKIVGKGTHDELMKNNEVYRQIALSQLSKEELEDGRE